MCLMPEIIFTDTTGVVSEDYYPKPSKMALPKWLKNLQPYYDDRGAEKQTGKRCIPMLDASMAGYTIFLTEDIMIDQTETEPVFRWPSGLGIGFHGPKQVGDHGPAAHAIPKWMSPWSMKTPKGYSCLFTPPLNGDKPSMLAFTGIVDTDTYFEVVNFPFMLANNKFEGIINAGTPLVQVFPFKRDEWNMKIEVGNTEEIKRSRNKLKSVFTDGYRNMFWSKKSYS